MFRITVVPVAAAVALGLLCASSLAQGDIQEISEDATSCTAVDPIAGSGASFYSLVQKASVWKVKDGLPQSKEDNIKIGVFFLDGTESQKEDVKHYARYLIERTGAPIEWIFGEKKHIRITFKPFKGTGNWSRYGTEAATPDEQPTMQLTVYNEDLHQRKPATKDQKKRTTLHEFGHAIGLMHEHLHPQSGFIFDEDRIVADVWAQNWCDRRLGLRECVNKVRDHITRPAKGDHACRGADKYDAKSLMHYPIPKDWLKRGKPVPSNTDLSPGDIACVQSLYLSPGPGTTQPPSRPRPPTPPISIGRHPPIGLCCGCCGYCHSMRNRSTFPGPRLPPRWVREFWRELLDDNW